jgi:tRNA G18 (ribose-2'-O)-methylase SpoU
MMRKLSHEEIVARQKVRQQAPRIPLTVVLNDIRSLYNVGAIFRTADGAGVEKIWICGITGHPPNNMISKTALGAEDTVPWEYRENCATVVRRMKEQGYAIVLLEQMESSLPHDIYVPRQPVCLVLGNEIHGVSPEILTLTDDAVEIEMCGIKNSLNVSVAFGVIAYSLRRYLKKGQRA